MADRLRGGIATNKVLVDPNGATSFDTDGNGTAATTDEYIELVNVSNAAISIAGLRLWDQGVGQGFTFPAGAVLQPGAHVLVITGIQSGGSLPTGGPNDLFYNAGRASAVINNTGDTLAVYDPTANQYIIARFGYATGRWLWLYRLFRYRDTCQRGPDGFNTFVNDQTPT